MAEFSLLEAMQSAAFNSGEMALQQRWQISHKHTIGHVATHSVHAVLARRHGMPAITELCDACNMRDRLLNGVSP